VRAAGVRAKGRMFDMPVLHFLSSLYRPDDDPDNGRNIVAKGKYNYSW
jgi:hypothetical protein